MIKSALNVCCCSAALFWRRPRCAPHCRRRPDADCLRAPLAVGAAMIVPATLADPQHLCREASQRNMALGLWAAVGRRRGLLARWWAACCWSISTGDRCSRSTCRLCWWLSPLTPKWCSRQLARRDQPLNLLQALILIAAILMLVFSAKSARRASWRCGSPRWWRRRGGDAHLVYPQTAVGGPADGGYATVHSSHYFCAG